MRVVAVVLVVLTACTHTGASPTHPARAGRHHCGPVRLDAGRGWRTRSTTANGLRIAEATTAAYHEPPAAFPDATLRRLPPNGIVVYAADYGRSSHLPRSRPLPYVLAEFRHDRGWEGQPAPNVPQYLLFTSLHGRLLDVQVFFGRQDPSGGPLNRAQAELASLRWGFCTADPGGGSRG